MVKTCSTSTSSSSCRPHAERPGDLHELVGAYIRHHRDDAARELRYFAATTTLGEAVTRATRAQLPDGKRHPHQRRISSALLEQAGELLAQVDLSTARNFEELHSKVGETIGGLHGIGELAVYDTAHRIGAFLGIEPAHVYLHRGARAGARSLGLGRGSSTLQVSELPTEFNRLAPQEIEDCLCLFRHDLKRLTATDRREPVPDQPR